MQSVQLSLLLASTACFGLLQLASAVPVLNAPSCPEAYGVQTYAHPEACDHFFLCTNGTLTLEQCENGLLYDGQGSVHNHCNYHWAVECGPRKALLEPINAPGCEFKYGIYPESAACSTNYIKCADGVPYQTPCDPGLAYDAKTHKCNWPDELLDTCNPEVEADSSPGCEFKFGIYPDSNDCSTSYIKCEHGYPYQTPCEPGLAYDEKSHKCNWPDELQHICNPEAVVGFKCPEKLDPHSPSAKFWPFPRFPVPNDCERLITCVKGFPRLITCGDNKVFDESTLTCEEPEHVPRCAHFKRK